MTNHFPGKDPGPASVFAPLPAASHDSPARTVYRVAYLPIHAFRQESSYGRGLSLMRSRLFHHKAMIWLPQQPTTDGFFHQKDPAKRDTFLGLHVGQFPPCIKHSIFCIDVQVNSAQSLTGVGRFVSSRNVFRFWTTSAGKHRAFSPAASLDLSKRIYQPASGGAA